MNARFAAPNSLVIGSPTGFSVAAPRSGSGRPFGRFLQYPQKNILTIVKALPFPGPRSDYHNINACLVQKNQINKVRVDPGFVRLPNTT